MNGSSDNDIDMDQDTPIDLKGAEQHHKLKNQKGEEGDPNHVSDAEAPSDPANDRLKAAIADGDADTAVGSALKKAVRE